MTTESENLTGLVQSEIPPEQQTLVKGHSVDCDFIRDQKVAVKFGDSTLRGKFIAATGFKDSCKVKVAGREFTVKLSEVQDESRHDMIKEVEKITRTVIDYACLIAAWATGLRDYNDLAMATKTHVRHIPSQVKKLQEIGLITKI